MSWWDKFSVPVEASGRNLWWSKLVHKFFDSPTIGEKSLYSFPMNLAWFWDCLPAEYGKSDASPKLWISRNILSWNACSTGSWVSGNGSMSWDCHVLRKPMLTVWRGCGREGRERSRELWLSSYSSQVPTSEWRSHLRYFHPRLYAIEHNPEIQLKFRTQASDLWLIQVVLAVSSYSGRSLASSGVYKVLNVQNDELYKMVAILLLSLGMVCYVAIGDWIRTQN